MEMSLNKLARASFDLSQTAIGKVLSGNEFQLKKFEFDINDAPPGRSGTTRDKRYAFNGCVITSGQQFPISSEVRVTQDHEGTWRLVNVDVFCRLSYAVQVENGSAVRTSVKDIRSYTLFENQSGNLTEVVR